MVPQNFPDRSVCVLGLGYVGLTLATAMADVGFDVTGVEIRSDVLEMLSRGEPHFHEPGLEERVKRNIAGCRLRALRRIPEDWGGTVYIITVGTPLNDTGRARLDMIENVSREVSEHLKQGDLVIMRSTVKLGTTQKVVTPILQRARAPFDLAFCPERTLEGKALIELRHLPQIVGGASDAAALRASQIFQFLTPTVVRVSDVETAEMIKLVDNAQRDALFAFSNEVARACDAVGIRAAEVIRAGKLGYPRTNLPLPGPVGGPCLEKDPHILIEALRELGVEPEMTIAARRINERQPTESAEFMCGLAARLHGFAGTPVIALLGIAFKGEPPTDDLRGTMAKPVLAALKERFPSATFRGYDVLVPREGIEAFGLVPCASIGEALDGASIAVILNNHPVFQSMPLAVHAERMARPGFVYDFWNCFEPAELRLPLGRGYVALGGHGRAIFGEEVPR